MLAMSSVISYKLACQNLAANMLRGMLKLTIRKKNYARSQQHIDTKRPYSLLSIGLKLIREINYLFFSHKTLLISWAKKKVFVEIYKIKR